MPIGKEQFLLQFTQQALDERISLFLGAGGSCDAGYPNWANLFAPIARDLGISIDESTDYYLLAQYYSNNFGSAELRKRINDRINKNDYKSRLLEELISIGFTNVWTTNFDNAVEKNYQQQDILINKVFRDSDFSNIDFNKRINVFKMNGDVTNLEGIVATQSDYERYPDSHRVMLMFFKRELISSTFLFIGYSFSDHLVLDCMSEITRYLGESANFHYAIMKDNPHNPYFSYFVEDLEKRYHIRVLLVNKYEEIPCVLADLNHRIRNKRVFISGSFRSYDAGIEEFSHTFSKSLAYALIDNDYRIVNGIGRRFGTHLIGYANECIAKQGIKDSSKHLIIKPFVGIDKGAAKDKKQSREKVIGQCGATIFVFGENNANSSYSLSGVFEEFQIAKKLHKTIIPIAYPCMVSEEIWKEVRNNLTRYPYLENCIDMLTSSQPSNTLADNIVQILDSVQKAT